jgi:hypothetical protein
MWPARVISAKGEQSTFWKKVRKNQADLEDETGGGLGFKPNPP